MDSTSNITHLYARAGFGLQFEDLPRIGHYTTTQAVEALFSDSAAVQPLRVVTSNLTYKDTDDSLTKKMFLQQQRQLERDLNLAWMEQMSTTNAQLREKMTLFWHNHFACRTQNPWYAQQLNNIQREHALGNFRTLLMEVSKSPAMLQFLNNQQNKKGHPNENFARELMELFTIGRGNYTEQDIKESARAFTGWGFNNNGDFVERDRLHDTEAKTFMGRTGNFTGTDIIDALLAKRQTARFISTKLYKYLVNDTPDKAHIDAMEKVLYEGKYEITPLLEFVFTANWFYDKQNTGNLIKSPVDLIIGLNRQFYVKYDSREVMMQFQRALGQVLFYPPNVAGWPGGKNWIDSSSLMYRIKIPSTLLNNGVIDFKGKTDPDDEAMLAAMPNNLSNNKGAVMTQSRSKAAWDKFLSAVPAGTSRTAFAQTLFSVPLNSNLQQMVTNTTDIKVLAVQLVSTPEYQLC